jgi:hypothetical protein
MEYSTFTSVQLLTERLEVGKVFIEVNTEIDK